MRNLIILIGILFVLVSCKRESNDSMNCDHIKKTTRYNENGEIINWFIEYYTDNQLVRKENSRGHIYEFEYNSSGLMIVRIINGDRTEYEYNSNNDIVKETYFKGNVLDYYRYYNYENNLLKILYEVQEDGDTTNCFKHFYGDDDKLDSLISRSYSEYHYYYDNVDSLVHVNNFGDLTGVYIFKYEDGKKVYSKCKIRSYETQQIEDHHLETWEYDGEFLTRHTNYYYSHDYLIDRRYFYNDFDEYERIDVFNKNGDLNAYFKYIYEDLDLIKIQGYDSDDNPTSYTIVEHTYRN